MKIEWIYSRNQRRHSLKDGESYEHLGDFYSLLEIRCCSPHFGIVQPKKYGYDLRHKGKIIAHLSTVKELKRMAEIIINP